MIKITDQNKNIFKFFCDECGKEIKDGSAECVFRDSENSSVVALTVHYECGEKFDLRHVYATGNVNLEYLLEKLSEVYK